MYFMSGLRNGFRELGFRNLPELHDGLEKEVLRMELRHARVGYWQESKSKT